MTDKVIMFTRHAQAEHNVAEDYTSESHLREPAPPSLNELTDRDIISSPRRAAHGSRSQAERSPE